MAGSKTPPLLGPDDLTSRFVFDLVYNPLETPLLKMARAKGITAISGVEMFVQQGARQFEIWTGKPAPEEEMLKVVLHALRQAADPAEAASTLAPTLKNVTPAPPPPVPETPAPVAAAKPAPPAKVVAKEAAKPAPPAPAPVAAAKKVVPVPAKAAKPPVTKPAAAKKAAAKPVASKSTAKPAVKTIITAKKTRTQPPSKPVRKAVSKPVRKTTTKPIVKTVQKSKLKSKSQR
jgi:3-dehydroquinate dehydratase/shikimate dehydrogenase